MEIWKDSQTWSTAASSAACAGLHPEGGARACLSSSGWQVTRLLAAIAHAAFVIGGAECIAWRQFGRPNEVPRIDNRDAHEKDRTTAPDWRTAIDL